MEVYVVLVIHVNKNVFTTKLSAVCDNLFIAKRYADIAVRTGAHASEVHKKVMNAPYTDVDELVYQTTK
jgi:hypothetical protein